MKKIILLTTILCTSLPVSATILICPTVDEIKKEQFNGWLPLYIDGEELASREDVTEFKKNITHFALAKWSASYLENGRCIYEGTTSICNKIILGKDAWHPNDRDNHWLWITPNKIAECYSSTTSNCGFIQ
jgi:hypothetical protein